MHICLFLCLKGTSCRFCSCSYYVCFTNGLLSPCLIFPLSFFPSVFHPYHIYVFPQGLIKRLSSLGKGRAEKRKGGVSGEEWSLLPHVWTGEGGMEVLFQLINRDTILLQSLCLSFLLSLSFPVSSSLHPQTLPLEIQ